MSARSPAARVDAAAPPVLLREDRDGVCVLTLNRPQARNALSEAMLEALGRALTDLAADPTQRAIIIAANGPAFSAGHDLKELTGRRTDPDQGRVDQVPLAGQSGQVPEENPDERPAIPVRQV